MEDWVRRVVVVHLVVNDPLLAVVMNDEDRLPEIENEDLDLEIVDVVEAANINVVRN